MTNAEIQARVSQYIPFKLHMSAREYDQRLAMIRSLLSPYARHKPKRTTKNKSGDYYGTILGEILHSIRRGEMDYVYNEPMLIEILRYEPSAAVEWLPDCGAWEVSLETEQKLRTA